MPLTPLTPASTRYFLRHRDGAVTGPFPASAITARLAARQLDGSEEISTDRQSWVPVQTLAGGQASLPTPAAPRGAPLDLGEDTDGILLAPLEIGGSAPTGGDAAAGAPGSPPSGGLVTGAGGGDAPAAPGDDDGIDMGAALELEERKPVAASGRPPGDQPSVAATAAAAKTAPRGTGGSRPPDRGDGGVADAATGASATVASLLEAEGAGSGSEAHQPLRLDEVLTAPAEVKPARQRTLTAARGGQVGIVVPRRWRPSRRLLVAGGGSVTVIVLVILTVVLDLPDRVRGEPARATVLGPTLGAIAQDRFSAFSEGARLLEEAAGTRRHTPVTRAAAAELLASSVVIHGGERGRIARAEALLEMQKEPGEPGRTARARARAWVALAKGRWKEAEQIAAETTTLPDGDRAILRGWAALGREDASRAAQFIQTALQAPGASPSPSRVAALYALARAREAEQSAEAEGAYRAVLKEAPAHVGAALGTARLSKLSAAGRLKLAEAVIAQQGRDASRVELAEAYVQVSRSAHETGAPERSQAALKRASEVNPGSVAAAVWSGDLLLAEGRTDEAVSRYKLALTAPVSTTRTSWVRFARLAALIEIARRAEAAAVLAELDRRLPGDARVPFWRGRAAERADPADPAAADQAYREALARDPRFLPASLQLARLLLDQRRGAEALAVLRRAEKQGAAATPLRLALGQALLASGNHAEAVRTFRQIVAADAKNPAAGAGAHFGAQIGAQIGLAAALEAQGDLEAARAVLAALSSRGDVPGVGAHMAALLVKLGRKQEALPIYRKEIAAGGDTGRLKVAAARLALDLGQGELARTLAQSAVDEDPRTPGALLVLAEVRRAAGDLGSALAELRRALAVDGSPEVQLEYGRALAALGRDEDALSALSQAQDIPEAAVERGRILLRRGDAEGATRQLTAATARLPRHAEAFLLLGDGEDRLGHAARAEAAWRTAARLAPTAPEARYRLGRLEMDRGHPAAALPHLRAAAAQLSPRLNEPKSAPAGEPRSAPAAGASTTAPAPPGTAAPGWRPDLFFQLGFAELRQGVRDRALAAFKRYLEIAAPDAPARAEVTRQIEGLSAGR